MAAWWKRFCGEAGGWRLGRTAAIVDGSHGTAFVPWGLEVEQCAPCGWDGGAAPSANRLSMYDGVEEPTAQKRCRGYHCSGGLRPPSSIGDRRYHSCGAATPGRAGYFTGKSACATPP